MAEPHVMNHTPLPPSRFRFFHIPRGGTEKKDERNRREGRPQRTPARCGIAYPALRRRQRQSQASGAPHRGSYLTSPRRDKLSQLSPRRLRAPPHGPPARTPRGRTGPPGRVGDGRPRQGRGPAGGGAARRDANPRPRAAAGVASLPPPARWPRPAGRHGDVVGVVASP